MTEQEYLAEKKRLADKLVKRGMPRNLVDNCARSVERQTAEGLCKHGHVNCSECDQF